jgi:hypothetical protein
MMALASVFMLSDFSAANIEHCNVAYYTLTVFTLIASPATAAMFFLRVKAIYFDNKIVVAFFGVLWLAFSGTIFLWTFSMTMGHIGTTQKCILRSVKHRVTASLLLHSAYDTLVFIAISLRIMSMAFSSRGKSLLLADGLPRLSRSLLLGGQLYYLFVFTYSYRWHLLMFLSQRHNPSGHHSGRTKSWAS